MEADQIKARWLIKYDKNGSNVECSSLDHAWHVLAWHVFADGVLTMGALMS